MVLSVPTLVVAVTLPPLATVNCDPVAPAATAVPPMNRPVGDVSVDPAPDTVTVPPAPPAVSPTWTRPTERLPPAWTLSVPLPAWPTDTPPVVTDEPVPVIVSVPAPVAVWPRTKFVLVGSLWYVAPFCRVTVPVPALPMVSVVPPDWVEIILDPSMRIVPVPVATLPTDTAFENVAVEPPRTLRVPRRPAALPMVSVVMPVAVAPFWNWSVGLLAAVEPVSVHAVAPRSNTLFTASKPSLNVGTGTPLVRVKESVVIEAPVLMVRLPPLRTMPLWPPPPTVTAPATVIAPPVFSVIPAAGPLLVTASAPPVLTVTVPDV